MLRTSNKLTIFDDANSVFSDYSIEGLDYDRDTFTITLNQSTSYLYVGFYKPINSFYTEVGTVNANAGTFVGEYYNGTAWTSLSGLYDESASFTRSGFIQWERGQDDEAATIVDSTELFWYRFRPSVTHSATVINGLNIVFADDTDLKREFFEVANFLPTGESSHILSHVAARDKIIQKLRKENRYITNSVDGKKDVNAFDIHDINQVKLAATYLCLSKIFGAVTDDPEGLYKTKSDKFLYDYQSAIKTVINIDKNDDGEQSSSEKHKIKSTRIFRQ